MTESGTHPAHDRILQAAVELLAEGGSEAVSTRAVSARAGVQAPTLYRLFGDKQGMLDALASYGFERYLADKHVAHGGTSDPLTVLRQGWDLHVDFGRTEPALYALMYGTVHPGQRPAAAKEAHQGLLAVVEQVAAAGMLKVPATLAAEMIQAVAVGVTLQLIATPDHPHGDELSRRARDGVLAAVTVGPEAPVGGSPTDVLAAHALALDAIVGREPSATGDLSPAEVTLLREWLARLTRTGTDGGA